MTMTPSHTQPSIALVNALAIVVLLSVAGLPGAAYAEEFDLEKEFSIQQKTTLDTFPLKEIDQDSLSDTAIEGALQVQSRVSADGKPIHVKLQEAKDQEKSGEVLDEAEKDPTREDELLKFSQSLPPEPQIQPIIYSEPTGRTYTDHHTTTTFRP